MIHTIETRLKLNTTQEALVNSCVILWSTDYHKTWKLWNNQQLKETEIYHELMTLNLFTSRQIGSLINKVKTEHAKIKELSKSQLKQQKPNMAASLWLARQSLYGEVYKEEVRNNISYVRYIKKYKEALVFPYDNFSK